MSEILFIKTYKLIFSKSNMALVESFSGIRGIYGVELTDEVIGKYAKAYYELLFQKNENPKIVIGRDTRPSGKNVFNELVKGLGDCVVIDVGVLPTPAIENAVSYFKCDGGIIITASHNEPEFNGFKFLDKDGALLRPKDIELVINKVHEIDKVKRNYSKIKIINKKIEAFESYKELLKYIIKTDEIKSKFKILVDPNGGTGTVSREIFDELGIRAEYVNMEEGKFNRLVEPNEASLKYLKEEIIKKNCDFAIGYDCDADRIEILLSDGTLVSGNQILALITEEILIHSEPQEKTVVVNDATSYLVKEIVDKYNGIWKEVEVGEINVVDKMIEFNSKVGGEGSNGGVIISPSKCRDGILTSLVLLKLINEKNKSLKELIDELPKYYYLKEKVKLKEDFVLLRDNIKKYYLNNGFQILETGDETGGMKAIKKFPEGNFSLSKSAERNQDLEIKNNSWIWFRQSKTEDKALRIIADSKIKETAIMLINEAKSLFK